LESVLEKTLGCEDSTEILDGATRAALLKFAAQNGGKADLSETLLSELVRIVLKQEFVLLAERSCGSAIFDQVAQSIWEDPSARGHVSDIWLRIQGQKS